MESSHRIVLDVLDSAHWSMLTEAGRQTAAAAAGLLALLAAIHLMVRDTEQHGKQTDEWAIERCMALIQRLITLR